jgi:hypothetical protein
VGAEMIQRRGDRSEFFGRMLEAHEDKYTSTKWRVPVFLSSRSKIASQPRGIVLGFGGKNALFARKISALMVISLGSLSSGRSAGAPWLLCAEWLLSWILTVGRTGEPWERWKVRRLAGVAVHGGCLPAVRQNRAPAAAGTNPVTDRQILSYRRKLGSAGGLTRGPNSETTWFPNHRRFAGCSRPLAC